MAGNTFGTIFRVTTFGESHGAAVGAVIDGCPAGLPLCEEDIQTYLDRRKPGTSRFSTARKEGDLCRILSGVFEGKTTGTPIAVIVENTDQRSGDYSALRDVYRPGHADLGYDRKYGFLSSVCFDCSYPHSSSSHTNTVYIIQIYLPEFNGQNNEKCYFLDSGSPESRPEQVSRCLTSSTRNSRRRCSASAL